MKLENFSLTQILRIFKSKIFLIRAAVVIPSIIFYFLLIDFYDKKLNLLDYINFRSQEFTVFSGSEGGMYFEIGRRLNVVNAKIYNQRTNGGYENPLSVLTQENSFGLVEDDIYPKDDVIRKQLNYVCPLYLERMHVLYRKDKIETLNISSSTNDSALKYLSKIKISTGPIGGGTKILASYIINELNNQIKDANKYSQSDKISLLGDSIQNISIKEGYALLQSGKIGAMFLVAGDPLDSIIDLMRTNKIGIASIDPSLTSDLNKKYQLDLRITDFKRLSNYAKSKNVIIDTTIATFGTYCYLITNNNTAPKCIKTFLENLESLEKGDTGNALPLDEFRFYKIYENSGVTSFWVILRNLLLFFASIFLSIIGLVPLSVWAISKYKHDKIVDELASLVKNIPDNRLPKSELETHEKNVALHKEGKEDEIIEYILPEIWENQIKIISLKIVPSIHELIVLRDNLMKDFADGVLTDEHYTFLMNRSDDLINKFRKALSIRLNEIVERNEKNAIDKLEKETVLRKYCTAEYLNLDEYELLKNKIKNR